MRRRFVSKFPTFIGVQTFLSSLDAQFASSIYHLFLLIYHWLGSLEDLRAWFLRLLAVSKRIRLGR